MNIRLLLPFLLFSLSCIAQVTFTSLTVAPGPTYYVDFESGDDTAAGTSQATAWKHIPGTRTTAGTSRLRSSWGSSASSALGTINRTTNKIKPGTTFLLKCGTTYSAATGSSGYIWVGDDWYTTLRNETNCYTIKPDTSWGTGAVVFDGSGWTESQIPNGIIFSQTDGLTIDGLVDGGIVFQNSPRHGIYATVSTGTTSVRNQTVRYCKFIGNGTYFGTLADDAARDTAAAGNGANQHAAGRWRAH